MEEQLKIRVLEYFKTYPDQQEVYVSGGELFCCKEEAESYCAGVMTYTSADAEAISNELKNGEE